LKKWEFKKLFYDDLALIENLISEDHFVIPKFIQFKNVLQNIYEKCKLCTTGVVATHIPELGKKDP